MHGFVHGLAQKLFVFGRREFTLNMMSEWFVESANHTCESALAHCLNGQPIMALFDVSTPGDCYGEQFHYTTGHAPV